MKTLILFLLIGITATAQIEIGLYQDVKLATMKDDASNDPFTTDLLLTVKLINQGAYEKWAKSIFVYPLVEYAELNGGTYIRYALGVGYKFKLNKFNISPSIDYGRIERWGGVYSSFNGLIEVGYMITDNIGLGLLGGLTQRNDLAYRWKDKTLTQSFYAGCKYLF